MFAVMEIHGGYGEQVLVGAVEKGGEVTTGILPPPTQVLPAGYVKATYTYAQLMRKAATAYYTGKCANKRQVSRVMAYLSERAGREWGQQMEDMADWVECEVAEEVLG